MLTRTVHAPAEIASVFAAAEQVVSRYFSERRDDPARGTIEISGERYVLVRAASLSVEFFSLVNGLYGAGREPEADDFARNVLFDLAHAIGKSDARDFHARMRLTDPIERLSAGPVHFSHAGWAFVDILGDSNPVPSDAFCLVYDHPYSFEADAWLRAERMREFPACIMSAGYSSGWCEESFGIELVASEILCRARNDERCRFVMAPPARIEEQVAAYATRHGLTEKIRGYQVPNFFARKRMEEELRRARDQLEQRVAEHASELRRAVAQRERIEEQLRQTHKLEAMGRLANGIAHDFNNLMSVVLTRTALLKRRHGSNESLCAELEQIAAAGQRAAALTQQLLAFSRSQVLRREPLDLDRVVGEFAALLRPTIGEAIELVMRLGSRCAVEADRGQLEQLVMNLVLNARDAMPCGGRLVIETTRVEVKAEESALANVLPGVYACLVVEDTGIGMDEPTRERIFEPFFTTKQGNGARKGSGLGLSTVYGIVRQSGGGITVRSAPAEGARFTIYLPTTERAVAPNRPEDASVHGGRETVLLVEDQADVRAALEDALREFGYSIHGVAGPEEALALVPRLPDLRVVVTDVVLPSMNGRELARRLLALGPDLRVIYVSGYTPDEELRDEVGRGTASFLQKPFRPDQLAGKIRALLDE